MCEPVELQLECSSKPFLASFARVAAPVPGRGRGLGGTQAALVFQNRAFERTFGRPCRIHRFGDRWSSPPALRALDRLGVAVDLTVEPGQRGAARMDATRPATGRIPDYRAERSEPRKVGDGLWSLPLSSADPNPALGPAYGKHGLEIRHKNYDFVIGHAGKLKVQPGQHVKPGQLIARSGKPLRRATSSTVGCV